MDDALFEQKLREKAELLSIIADVLANEYLKMEVGRLKSLINNKFGKISLSRYGGVVEEEIESKPRQHSAQNSVPLSNDDTKQFPSGIQGDW